MDAEPHPRRTHPPDALFSGWTAPDGWRHRRMDWRQPEGAPVRGTLLFAGGRGDFVEKYLEAYRHWHGRGWNVTAFDWRGQGSSRGDIVGGHLSDFGVLVEDLAALLADLRAGPGPHVAIAHSMGGHMLLRCLIERKPALDAAVLVAPMILINGGPLPAWIASRVAGVASRVGWARRPVWKAPAAPSPPGSARQAFLTSCPDRYADELWWRSREPGFDLGAPSWGWVRAAYRSAAQWFTPERLSSVETPLLVLGTDRDRLVSPAAIRRVARLVPNAELNMYPAAGHEILREADPVRLDALARIDSFLDENAG